ncbi:hypothetical protein BH24DEI2_BH24DEI2_22760 [soil metagenome]
MDFTEKVYLSYDLDDRREVEAFLTEFDFLNDSVLHRNFEELPVDIVKNSDKHEVIHHLREQFLKDSAVTLVLLGKCTFAKRAVDLELMASLHGAGDVMATAADRGNLPNGLVAVMLKSYEQNGFPDRLNENLVVDERELPYAVVIPYPETKEVLAEAVQEAERRRRDKVPNNTPVMLLEDKACL